MTAGAPLLELQNIRVVRGGVLVLDVPSFCLYEREFVSLIGPNGSGKTTLLLTIMCLLERAAGEIRYRGEAIVSERATLAWRRRLAMVLQEPLLFDTTVFENVASGLRIRGEARGEVKRKVIAWLERFTLAPLAQRSARKLSGGEARRVSLARAVAVEPDIILLDEPFANLDAPARQSITEDLKRTIRDAGMAAILVTHDRTEALRLSDRMVVMNEGRIVQADTPAVVMNSPANEFIAACVGMDTILEGVITRSAGRQLIIAIAGKEMAAVGDGEAGDQVYCCIRPENVTIELVDPGSKTSARNVFRAEIVNVSPMGSFLKVKLDCGFPLVSDVTPESFANLELGKGKEVFASIKATAVHVIGKGDRRSVVPIESGEVRTA